MQFGRCANTILQYSNFGAEMQLKVIFPKEKTEFRIVIKSSHHKVISILSVVIKQSV